MVKSLNERIGDFALLHRNLTVAVILFMVLGVPFSIFMWHTIAYPPKPKLPASAAVEVEFLVFELDDGRVLNCIETPFGLSCDWCGVHTPDE